MPLSRMTVPKALRDKMTLDLGLDGYQGTPEKINNDAVLPVYVMGSAANEEPFLSKHGFGTGEEMTGTQEVCRIPIWGDTAGLVGTKMFLSYPNNQDYFLALNHLMGRIAITASGRSTITGNNSNTVRVELICIDGEDYNWQWIMGAWKWNIGSFSGQPWIGEFSFNASYIAEVSSPNRIKIRLNSSLGIDVNNSKGFILRPRGSYYFQLTWQSATTDMVIPAETTIDVHAEGDFYKTNTRILTRFETLIV